MGLGGDIERVMSMLHRAGIPFAMDEDLSWLETPSVRFFFYDSGRHLRAVIPSDPLTSATDALEDLKTRG
jgi:hypothetical protein